MTDFKRRKRFCLWALTLLMALPSSSAAHPPKGVSLNWNPAGELTVNAAHSVDNPEKHYIYRITIYADNKMVATKDYQAQTNAEGMTDTFPLGILPGGTNLKAEVFCVIMGNAAGSIVVP